MPLHFFLKQDQIRIPIHKDLTEESFEETAARGHNPKSLPTLIRALDTAKEYELPLLRGAIEAIIYAAPEAYDALKESDKAKITRLFSPP